MHEHRDQSRPASVAADELPMRFPWLPLRPRLLLLLLLLLSCIYVDIKFQ